MAEKKIVLNVEKMVFDVRQVKPGTTQEKFAEENNYNKSTLTNLKHNHSKFLKMLFNYHRITGEHIENIIKEENL